MTANYKVSTRRAPSAVSQAGAGERLVSSDGSKWAISRNRKMSLGNRTFTVVTSWELKQRVDGKAVTRFSDRSEEAAREWVK